MKFPTKAPLWASEATGNAILRIVPADGTLTRFDTGVADEPTAICAGPDGNLWFGSGLPNFIGRITTAGDLTVFTGFGNFQSRVLGICAGPDGNLWFTQFAGQRIGRITTAGAPTEFNLFAGSDPVGICAGPDGNHCEANSLNHHGSSGPSAEISHCARQFRIGAQASCLWGSQASCLRGRRDAYRPHRLEAYAPISLRARRTQCEVFGIARRLIGRATSGSTLRSHRERPREI